MSNEPSVDNSNEHPEIIDSSILPLHSTNIQGSQNMTNIPVNEPRIHDSDVEDDDSDPEVMFNLTKFDKRLV